MDSIDTRGLLGTGMVDFGVGRLDTLRMNSPPGYKAGVPQHLR